MIDKKQHRTSRSIAIAHGARVADLPPIAPEGYDPKLGFAPRAGKLDVQAAGPCAAQFSTERARPKTLPFKITTPK